MWDMENVETGHFRLTSEQRHFKHMLSAYPRFTRYWDFESRDCRLDAIDQDIGAMSSGEQIMLRFFASVWLGETREFDLINAVKTLDADHLQVIINWLNNPVFP